MKTKQKIIITILSIVGACSPFGLLLIFLKPIPNNVELPLTVQVFSSIGIFALIFFTMWLICLVANGLWVYEK